MSAKKGYDSTLVRVAGNIASGICAHPDIGEDMTPDQIAERAMAIAICIVRLAHDDPAGHDQEQR